MPERSNRRALPRKQTVLKGVVLVLLFAVLAIPAVFVNTLLGYLPALFYLFVLLASYAYGRMCFRYLEYDELLDMATCVRGSAGKLLVRLNNRSLLHIPNIKLEFTIRSAFDEQGVFEQARVALAPRSSEDFHLDVRFAHIGEYVVGLRRITVYDPFSLFSKSLQVDSYETVLVTPQVKRLDDITLSDAEFELNQELVKASIADGLDYNSVRDYEYGDPMKHVHWKLSARQLGLLTKVFERQSNPSLDIYLDFSASTSFGNEQLFELCDLMIETALALSTTAFENGLDTRLLFLKDDELRQFSLSYGFDLRSLVRALPKMNAARTSFDELLLNNGTSLYAAANIAVCSPTFSENVIGAAERVRKSGRNVLAFAFLPHDADASLQRAMLARLAALGGSDVTHSLICGEEELR